MVCAEADEAAAASAREVESFIAALKWGRGCAALDVLLPLCLAAFYTVISNNAHPPGDPRRPKYTPVAQNHTPSPKPLSTDPSTRSRCSVSTNRKPILERHEPPKPRRCFRSGAVGPSRAPWHDVI
jgi:hypothetical protein